MHRARLGPNKTLGSSTTVGASSGPVTTESRGPGAHTGRGAHSHRARPRTERPNLPRSRHVGSVARSRHPSRLRRGAIPNIPFDFPHLPPLSRFNQTSPEDTS